MYRRNFLLATGAAAGLAACSKKATPPLLAVSNAEVKLEALGIQLPEAPAAKANYAPYRLAGDVLYIAGQGPDFGNQDFLGTVGSDLTTEQGYAAARSAAIFTLAQVRKGARGSLNNVVKCLKLDGFVNSANDYNDQAKVLNGATDLFVEVFGDAGRPARFAVGVNTLPFNISVEMSTIWQIRI